jgi:hypothetical protein
MLSEASLSVTLNLRSKSNSTPTNYIVNKVMIIGRLGKNAEGKTAQNKKDFAVLSIER